MVHPASFFGHASYAWFLAAVIILTGHAPAAAQDAQVANRTLESVEALNDENWSNVTPGLRVIQAQTGSGIVISAFEFSLDRFQVSAQIQSEPRGDRAHEVGERSGHFFVVNAGFFLEDEQNHLAPVGLLSINGNRAGMNWRSAGGYLVLGEQISIRPTRSGPPKGAQDFIQTKPVLIEPGKIWAMNTNQAILKRRTLVCLRGDETLLVVLVSGNGMSLFEAGWLLRSKQWGGFFDCDSAIAMDGGGSTQSWMRDHSQYSLRGVTPVHNFLVFKER